MDTTHSDARVIEDRKAADALTDLAQLPLLAHFLRGASSVSEAAEALGEDLDRVYYQVRKLEKLGLLEVAFEEARAGRPIKHYRASAQAFFVPYAVLPHETFARALLESSRVPEELMAEGSARALLERIDDPWTWGFRVYRDAEGAVNAFWGPREAGEDWDVLGQLLGPEEPPVFGTHTSLALTREQAKEMQRELHAFTDRWIERARANRAGEADGPTRAILLSLGMAPAPSD